MATCPEAAIRDTVSAVQLAERAVQLAPEGNPIVLDALGAAYAADGQFERAVEIADRASRLATAGSFSDLAAELQTRRTLYGEGRAFVATPAPAAED